MPYKSAEDLANRAVVELQCKLGTFIGNGLSVDKSTYVC
jgi:hypothetical protein